VNEITYYFGAGASCQSMPLVADFEKRFDYFLDYVKRLNLPGSGTFLEYCTQFKRDVSSHLSFDTLFKKLYHKQDNGTIQLYKSLILAYFIYEQLLQVPEETDPDKRVAGKSRNPDPRYEALIAGLLKPLNTSIEFYTRVNFITWNYDANLVEALRTFVAPYVPLHKFILDKLADGQLVCTPQASITHLNGLINHPQVNKGFAVPNETLNHILDELIHDFDRLSTYSSLISFSWEKLSYINGYLQMPDFVVKAKEAVQRSRNIVIVGYSFPLYNRPIDSFILNRNTLSGKDLYIQSPDAAQIKEILANDFNIQDIQIAPPGLAHLGVKAIKQCSSFFVPNTIFRQTLREIDPTV
jgi:hypothetical protein